MTSAEVKKCKLKQTLVDVLSVCSLYLNALSDVGKQSLYVRGDPHRTGRRVKVLASVTEGSDISEDWHPILNVIRKNASSWDRQRVQQQLQVFSQDACFDNVENFIILYVKMFHF